MSAPVEVTCDSCQAVVSEDDALMMPQVDQVRVTATGLAVPVLWFCKDCAITRGLATAEGWGDDGGTVFVAVQDDVDLGGVE